MILQKWKFKHWLKRNVKLKCLLYLQRCVIHAISHPSTCLENRRYWHLEGAAFLTAKNCSRNWQILKSMLNILLFSYSKWLNSSILLLSKVFVILNPNLTTVQYQSQMFFLLRKLTILLFSDYIRQFTKAKTE